MNPQTPSSPSNSTVIASPTGCLEYGDGAGPCGRPYGSPNPTPQSWISSLAAESVDDDTSTLAVGATTSVLPIGIPAMTSVNSLISSSIDASLSSWIDTATMDASLCEPTTTVYVTVKAGTEPNNGNLTILGGGGAGHTTVESSTSLSILTMTWSGSDGPLTTTETAFPGGATGTAGHTVLAINGTGSLTTLSVPDYTLTMQTTVGANRTALSGPSPTVSLAPLVTSGGEKLTAPKPLGMSGSGNGVYCVVMLAALAMLLM